MFCRMGHFDICILVLTFEMLGIQYNTNISIVTHISWLLFNLRLLSGGETGTGPWGVDPRRLVAAAGINPNGVNKKKSRWDVHEFLVENIDDKECPKFWIIQFFKYLGCSGEKFSFAKNFHYFATSPVPVLVYKCLFKNCKLICRSDCSYALPWELKKSLSAISKRGMGKRRLWKHKIFPDTL